MDQCQRLDVLLDAVLEDLELILRQVRNELVLLVADDRVHVDEVDGHAERGRLLGRRGGRLAGGALSGHRNAGCDGHGKAQAETKSLVLHSTSIRRKSAPPAAS